MEQAGGFGVEGSGTAGEVRGLWYLQMGVGLQCSVGNLHVVRVSLE